MPSPSPGPTASRPPRILVGGWAGAGNVGDELLTRAAIRLLRTAGAEPVVASRDPEATARAHRVEAIGWGRPRRGGVTALDGACVGPGGIIQDSSSLWSLPGHLALPAVVRRGGGPLLGLGLGAEPLRRAGSARMLRAVLGGQPILCRDGESAVAMTQAGVAAAVAPDLAFTLDAPHGERRDELVVAIGPEVRPGRVAPASRRLDRGDVDAITEALDAVATRLGIPIAFVAFRGARDRAMAEALAGRVRARCEVVADDVDVQVERVAGATAVLTSRYHALVVALRAGTPAVVISSQAKLTSLIAMPGADVVATTWPALAAVPIDPTRRTPVAPDTAALATAVGDLVDRATAAHPGGSGR